MTTPRRFTRRHQRGAVLVGALLCASAVALVAPAAPALAADGLHTKGIIPPNNPPANVPPTPSYCLSPATAPPGYPPDRSNQSCPDALVAAISNARALEGDVPPLYLPRDWESLTPDEQLFVVLDSERVARGLPPVVGITASLDAIAQKGADDSSDPYPPAGFGLGRGTSIGVMGSVWAGGSYSPLFADYLWMYDDGWGGSRAATGNVDCTSAHAAGCWGHRDIILRNYLLSPAYGSQASTALMGAGVDAQVGSYAAFFVAMSGPVPKLLYTWSQAVAEGALGPSFPVAASAIAASGTGYDVARTNGSIADYGTAPPFGDLTSAPYSPVVSMSGSPGGDGYFAATAAGSVYGFGFAGFYGSLAGKNLSSPVVGIAAAPFLRGYWLVTADGKVYAFGTAHSFGSLGARQRTSPVVAIAATSSGTGYLLVTARGHVYAFGTARSYGSISPRRQTSPVVGVAMVSSGTGYLLATASGAVFALGSARFHGSLAGRRLVTPVAGIAAEPSGTGYWLVQASGIVTGFGGAKVFHVQDDSPPKALS